MVDELGGTFARNLNNSSLEFNPVKFRAYRNAAQNTSAGAFTKILFDSESYDTGNNFDSTTNNRFVAPYPCTVHFDAAGGIAASAGTTQVVIALYKNGSVFSVGSQIGSTASSGSIYSTVSDTLALLANDYVEVFIFCNGTTAMAVGATTPYFSGYLVSLT